MTTSGDLELTIADGSAAAISLPANEVQVVLGCCASGTSYDILATRQPQTLLDTFSYGPLSEAAALTLAAGGTVLAMRIPTTTAGAVAKKATKSVSGATVADPSVITTTTDHGLVTGDVVTIAAVGGTTTVNGTWVVTVISSTTFSVPIAGVGAYTSGGTVTPLGAINSNTAAGAAEIYFTGAAYDQYYIEVTIITGGTIGTDEIQFTVSLDAGRTTNLARVTLDTSGATTYAIPQTNVTINFGTGDVEADDTARGYTTAPLWTIADVTTAMTALADSPYASSGWGSIHLVGTCAGSDAGTIGTNLETWATTDLMYDRMMGEVRDASPPEDWGGTEESDSDWSTSVIADFSAVTSKRLGVAAGFYNMRSAYPNPIAGQPLYRRPLGWAWAARVVALAEPADHEGWVALGGLSQITTDPVNDPTDGFVYHDEQATGPVFNNLGGGPGRMTAARMRRRKIGWFIANPLTLASPGSDYQLMPRGRVMDIASDAIQESGSPYVNARVKLNPNGTITALSAGGLETALYNGLDQALAGQISGRTVAVDRTWNVQSTNTIKITATIQGDAYALEINVTLAYGTPQ
jgi:hypothetical protein